MVGTITEALGPRIRRQRRRLGLTLDDLATRTGISKPYLSLIETSRVPNPPSDEKLRKLEQSLGFVADDLVSQAHLQRTPRDVRAMIHHLMENAAVAKTASSAGAVATGGDVAGAGDAALSGMLRNMAGQAQSRQVLGGHAAPVINRLSAGYPRDFNDLTYPPRVAEDYVSCPDVRDKDAFAIRVHGDAMMPAFRAGDIVIFSPSLSARHGDDCFVRFGDGSTTFRRIFFETGEAGAAAVRLQPRNEAHRSSTVPSVQVASLYKAVYKYQRLDGD